MHSSFQQHTSRRAGRAAAAVIVATMALVGAACGDDDESVADQAGDVADSVAEGARDAAGEVGDLAEDASARSVAEAFRAALLSDEADGANRRSVAVLQESAGDLPGDPEVRGIDDADGDGRDDDGRVELAVNDESSCLMISETGDLNIEDC